MNFNILTGLPTNYHVLYNENEIIVRNQTEALYCHRFPVGTEVISIDYLQSNGLYVFVLVLFRFVDGQFGLLVLYNDIDKGYLARLAEYGGILKIVHEVLLPHAVSRIIFPFNYLQGTCLKVIIDDMEMPHNLPNLARPMQKWRNIVVAGTQFGHAYVLYMPIDEKWGPNDNPQERNLTDALGIVYI